MACNYVCTSLRARGLRGWLRFLPVCRNHSLCIMHPVAPARVPSVRLVYFFACRRATLLDAPDPRRTFVDRSTSRDRNILLRESFVRTVSTGPRLATWPFVSDFRTRTRRTDASVTGKWSQRFSQTVAWNSLRTVRCQKVRNKERRSRKEVAGRAERQIEI